MADNKQVFYQRETTINGKKYIAQFNGLSAALRAVDENYIEGTNNIGIGKLASYVFKHVIVEPKGLTADSFESIDELNEVLKWAQGVMQGKFRDAD